MNELGKVEKRKVDSQTSIWNVEVTDIGAHRPFLGFSLTDQYLLIGVTSPRDENLVSIHTIPEKKIHQFSIPLDLERHQLPILGEIHFKGIDALVSKWSIGLYDRRFNETVVLSPFEPASIKPLLGRELHQTTDWSGFKKSKKNRQPIFELHFTRK